MEHHEQHSQEDLVDIPEHMRLFSAEYSLLHFGEPLSVFIENVEAIHDHSDHLYPTSRGVIEVQPLVDFLDYLPKNLMVSVQKVAFVVNVNNALELLHVVFEVTIESLNFLIFQVDYWSLPHQISSLLALQDDHRV